MKPVFDQTYEPRMWRCEECRRVLGVVMRDENRVRRLWVFRVDRDDVNVPETSILRKAPRGLFKVHGCDCCHGVECSMCGAFNRWNMSEESFRVMQFIHGLL